LRASIIALCYNHKSFLDEALSSLENLGPEVEVIVCDDASSDGSGAVLERWRSKKPDWKFIFNEKNTGNCRSFNSAISLSSGAWILDFSTDDVLIPDAFLRWLAFAEGQPEAGFIYADAFVFSRKKEEAKRFSAGVKPSEFPEGKIFSSLFRYNFICPPAVLFHAGRLKAEGGYQNRLAYEDWDIWLRLAGKFQVRRFAETVIFYRKHPASLSASLVQRRNKKLPESTLMILKDVIQRPEFQDVSKDDFALFVRYQLRLCFFLQLPEQAAGFFEILKQQCGAGIRDRLLVYGSDKLGFIYPLYRRLKS
jgi:glycosyltransferase involved in cell wall biosynthesis